MALVGSSAAGETSRPTTGPLRRAGLVSATGLGWTDRHLVWLSVLVLAPVGILSAARGFDGLYGQDAFAYFDYAVGPLRTAILHGQVASAPPFFWPPGYPALVSLLSLAAGAQPLAGQLVALLMGASVPVATALLARELWPSQPRRALLAGGVAGVCGQLWQSSAVIMSDTTGLALSTLGVWATVRYQRRPEARWLVLAAALLGWATITRWIYGLVALVGATSALAGLLRGVAQASAGTNASTPSSARRPSGRPRRVLVHGLPAALVGVAIIAWVLVPAVSQGAFVGTLETYGSDTWSLPNLFKREFLTTGHGFVHYALPNGLYYAGAPLHPFMLTPLLGVLVAPGLLALARARAWGALGVLVGWVVAMYLFHAGSTWQNLRYVLAYLPPVAILAAVGADALLERRRRLAGLWLVVGLVWAAAGGVVLTNQFIERKNADLATVAWVDAQLPSNAELLTFGPTLMFRHYSQRPTLELFEVSPPQIATLLSDGRPRYLLLDVVNVEEQWSGRAPAEDYHWLRDGPGLTPLGTSENLTLFRIGRA